MTFFKKKNESSISKKQKVKFLQIKKKTCTGEEVHIQISKKTAAAMSSAFSQNAQPLDDDYDEDVGDCTQASIQPQASTTPKRKEKVLVYDTDDEAVSNYPALPAKRPCRPSQERNPWSRFAPLNDISRCRPTIQLMWNHLIYTELGLSVDDPWVTLPQLPGPLYSSTLDNLAGDLSPGPLREKVLLLSTVLSLVADDERRDQEAKNAELERKQRLEMEEKRKMEEEAKETQERKWKTKMEEEEAKRAKEEKEKAWKKKMEEEEKEKKL